MNRREAVRRLAGLLGLAVVGPEILIASVQEKPTSTRLNYVVSADCGLLLQRIWSSGSAKLLFDDIDGLTLENVNGVLLFPRDSRSLYFPAGTKISLVGEHRSDVAMDCLTIRPQNISGEDAYVIPYTIFLSGHAS